MWLDRLAGNQANNLSAPPPGSQPSSRPYSPLPRRVSNNLSPYATSQRPGGQQQQQPRRTSSLSLATNDSTTSLLSSARKPVGSGLRQAETAPHDAANRSLEILDRLLRTADDHDAPRSTITDHDFQLDPDFGGLSLRELADSEPGNPPSRVPARPQPPQDYEKQQTKFDDLRRSINACDQVLSSVETYLASFQSDLATVSADIESLQTRSATLNRRLDNRKAVEKALGPLVEDLSISPEVISKISEGHIDEMWAKMLSEIDRRTASYEAAKARSQHSKASEDLGPLLEKLTAKAIQRIRDFLVAQIKALRSPHINAQILQQQNFLRFKDLFTFLHKHHSALAEEISLAYMNTMRWYYANQFGRYERALAQLKLHVLDRTDALGQEDMSRRATVLTGGSRVAAGPPHDAFNLGRRIDTLRTDDQSALSSYLAEEDPSTHYLEVPFRNFNLALVDNATAEYTFLATFFSPALSYATISKNFNYIFDPTFDLGRTLSKTLVSDSYDALGVLLCIRLNQRFAFELQRRKVPALEGYVNATNMLLWPRLQLIMDRHCESVHTLASAVEHGGGAGGGGGGSSSKNLSAAPHLVAQRFAQILHGFLSLSADASDDEPVGASLRRLRNEVQSFLDKQAQAYSAGAERQKGKRFLYNNISLILTIISDTDGKLALEHQSYFEDLKKKYQDIN
ncbi:vacuolar protein sorting-associated protein 52 [Geosmithia morbida]|uniref:Vacuolar protein sorting-associated protein 52 n=1 Tax=Geosmithia morbida TaxID=1094350 RepID=A0A9P4YY85_9HYPO|nr:vacuolar protein sorting-associated protein 52 [Geosmithia morbida]KAF4125288.1 vacuolar protein sorting-associated protein 52 [Geosmithia morbida]